MPSRHEQHHSPYGIKQLFDMVADVKSYPQFIPWVAAARITRDGEKEFEAELVAKFKGFTGKYTSRVTLHESEGECSIDVTMIEGPFHHLTNNWKFIPDEKGSSTIVFDIDFAFKSKVLEKLIGGLFDRATMKMLSAFEERADELYG